MLFDVSTVTRAERSASSYKSTDRKAAAARCQCEPTWRWSGLRESVPDLVREIEQFVSHYNLHAQPFMWTATADSILASWKDLVKLLMGHDTNAECFKGWAECSHRSIGEGESPPGK